MQYNMHGVILINVLILINDIDIILIILINVLNETLARHGRVKSY